MIPILYDTNETAFVNNGLCRLRDCISAIVTEERNGVYELDFEYPVTGANYDLIQVGRIVAVTHDDTGDVQPFDIVSYTKPLDGVVTFHCTHISYRQSYITCTAPKDSIGTINDAFFQFYNNVSPANPFSYDWIDLPTQFGYMAAADGLPHSVRQMLGGMEGSVLDTFGGEFEWDKFNVNLYWARGTERDFTIRYGVNMLDYNDELDTEGAYSSCIPYWTNGGETVIGDRTLSGDSTATGRGECVPLDLTDKFETKPTKTQLQNLAKTYMDANNTFLAGQTITVSFVRLQDVGEYSEYQNLLQCRLCDTVNVIFPDYKMQGKFKIVKTVWNVLEKRFDEMELGKLSTSLVEAIGEPTGLTGPQGPTGPSGADGASIKYVFIRDNWTQSGWSTRTVGTTMQVTPKNYNSSGVATNPPGYDYQNVKVGDLIMVTGTATDSKVAWTNIYKVNTAPTSSAADIPSTCQSHVYADRGAQGAQGVSVTGVQPQYYLSTSSSSPTGGTWGTTLNYTSGYYIWTRSEITYSNGTTGYSTAVYDKALTETCELSEDTSQYFWTKETSGTTDVPTGTYVTEKKQSEYDDSQGGTPTLGSVLIRSAGIYIRQAAATIAQFLSSGITLFNPNNGKKQAEFNTSGVKLYAGDASETVLANFGTSDATIQKAKLKYSEDGSTFGLDNSHRVVLTKSVDESGVRNDATLSSRDISTFTSTTPMAFVNANHYASGSTKYGEIGMYAWGGSSSIPAYVILNKGNSSGTVGNTNALTINSGNLTLDTSGLILSTGVISASNITTDEANIAALQDDVTTLYNNKADSTGFFKVVDLSWTEPSISAHSNGTNATHTVPSASRPAGMTLVGIVGWQSGNYRIYPYVYRTNGAHSISVTMANATTGNSASTTVHAYLLYIKATSA